MGRVRGARAINQAMKNRTSLDPKRFLAAVAAVTFFATLRGFAGEPDPLEKTFLVPPTSAKPAMWWFWGESVTTDHGITQDLEALKRVGFGGVVIYEQVFGDGLMRSRAFRRSGWRG